MIFPHQGNLERTWKVWEKSGNLKKKKNNKKKNSLTTGQTVKTSTNNYPYFAYIDEIHKFCGFHGCTKYFSGGTGYCFRS